MASSNPSPPLAWIPSPSGDSGTMEKLLQTVELESWAWWMSSKCGLIPWGVAGGGGWLSWWHLMECRAFYLWDVNLSGAPVEWKPRPSTEGCLQSWKAPQLRSLPVWGHSSHIPSLSGPNQLQFGRAEEADGDTVFIATFADQAKLTLLIMNGTYYTIDLCPSNSQVIIDHRSNWAGAMAVVFCKPHVASHLATAVPLH